LLDLRENERRIFALGLGVSLTLFFYFAAHSFGFLTGGRAMLAEARSAIFFVIILETEDRFMRIIKSF